MAGIVEIRLSGAGGQGLQLSARILAAALAREGRHIALSQSYEPTSRGGNSRADLVISDTGIDYPLVTALDFLVILDQIAAEASNDLIKPGAIVLADTVRVPGPPVGPFAVHPLPFVEVARRLGNERIANIVALGTLAAVSDVCRRDTLQTMVSEEVPGKLLDLNLEALAAGFQLEPATVRKAAGG
jgi:2-oxoglutarate ferredoxin oxidoreductase subunit gamma